LLLLVSAADYNFQLKVEYGTRHLRNGDICDKVINYIRNSVKVLIDAYDGTTKFYITDTSDPLIMAYKNISEIPAEKFTLAQRD